MTKLLRIKPTMLLHARPSCLVIGSWSRASRVKKIGVHGAHLVELTILDTAKSPRTSPLAVDKFKLLKSARCRMRKWHKLGTVAGPRRAERLRYRGRSTEYWWGRGRKNWGMSRDRSHRCCLTKLKNWMSRLAQRGFGFLSINLTRK